MNQQIPPWAHQPGQWPPPEQPKPKPKRKKWPWFVGGAAILFVAIGVAGQQPPPPEAPLQQVAPVQEASEPTYQAPSYPTMEPGEPYTSGIGSGTFIVGEDIEQGTYKSSGAEQGLFEFCSWTTKKGASSNSDIIDLGTANANEPQVVEIGPGVKAFESNGCEPWEKVE